MFAMGPEFFNFIKTLEENGDKLPSNAPLEQPLEFEFNNSSCYVCNGYYGPSFGEPVCVTCHAFLFPDFPSYLPTSYFYSEKTDDGDSGNDEPSDLNYSSERKVNRACTLPSWWYYRNSLDSETSPEDEASRASNSGAGPSTSGYVAAEAEGRSVEAVVGNGVRAKGSGREAGGSGGRGGDVGGNDGDAGGGRGEAGGSGEDTRGGRGDAGGSGGNARGGRGEAGGIGGDARGGRGEAGGSGGDARADQGKAGGSGGVARGGRGEAGGSGGDARRGREEAGGSGGDARGGRGEAGGSGGDARGGREEAGGSGGDARGGRGESGGSSGDATGNRGEAGRTGGDPRGSVGQAGRNGGDPREGGGEAGRNGGDPRGGGGEAGGNGGDSRGGGGEAGGNGGEAGDVAAAGGDPAGQGPPPPPPDVARSLQALSTPRPPDNLAPGLVEQLPSEVLLCIFNYLDDLSLCACACVCARWWRLVRARVAPPRWAAFTARRFPLYRPLVGQTDWHKKYQSLVESCFCRNCLVQMCVQAQPDGEENAWRRNRLRIELKMLRNDPPEGIAATPLDAKCCHWQASVTGPVGSPYEGGIFYLYIQVPYAYPMSPPVVRFLTRILHPNISRHGDVGIDSVHHNWSLALTISKVLISIQSLLTDPYTSVCMEPELGEMYVRDRPRFETLARNWTWRYAMHDILPH